MIFLDIQILHGGAAKVMGFKLMLNFNRPYFAKSVAEFWKRWHISLSTWFKDYLYIPLGGNRVGIPRWYFNLLVVFLLSGLWHGANYTFIIWGALHGFYLISNIIFNKQIQRFYEITGLNMHKKCKKALQISVTFSLVCFAWIFFRVKNIGDAQYIITHLFNGLVSQFKSIFIDASARNHLLFLDHNFTVFCACICGISFMEMVHRHQGNRTIAEMMDAKPKWQRWGIYYVVCLLILFFGVYAQAQQFIYFQF